MGQQILVARRLKFLDSAYRTENVEGNVSFKRLTKHWEFQGKAIDNTNDWTVTDGSAGTDGTFTITSPHCLTITSGAADNDDEHFASELCYYGQYNPVLEVRARNDDVSGMAHFIGFSDAQSETNTIAFTLATATLTSTASDGAGFLLDVDATTKTIRAVSVKGDSDGTVIDSSHTEGDASWATYRVELRDNGTTCDALFYLNTDGKSINPWTDIVGVELDAVTRTTALCIYIGVMNREAAANTLDVDYIKVWSDRR